MGCRKSSLALIVLFVALTTGSLKASADSQAIDAQPVSKTINMAAAGFTARISVDSNGNEGNGDSAMP